jgi:DNA-binding FrmR family transcriptional regulator
MMTVEMIEEFKECYEIMKKLAHSTQNEINSLSNRVVFLEGVVTVIRDRLDELEGSDDEDSE